MKKWAESFYNSLKWRKCRKAFIAYRTTVDGGLCERCHKEPGYIVHHKVYLTPNNIKDPDVTLNINNLEWLCHGCHDAEHLSRLRVRFDENGRVLPLESKESEVSDNEFSD